MADVGDACLKTWICGTGSGGSFGGSELSLSVEAFELRLGCQSLPRENIPYRICCKGEWEELFPRHST